LHAGRGIASFPARCPVDDAPLSHRMSDPALPLDTASGVDQLGVASRRLPSGRRAAGLAWSIALQLLGFAIFIAIWWLLARRDPLTVPSPSQVWNDLRDNFLTSDYLEAHGLADGTGYWFDLWYSVQNVLLGVVIGTAIGVCLGLISVPVPIVSQVLNPIMATFGAAPIFVAAPFFLVWFGVVSTAQVTMVAFYTAVLLYIFSRRSAENVQREYLESAACFGARPREIFRRVYVPATVPELLGGFRIALAGAWGLEAIAELLGAQHGIGFLINYYSTVYGLVGMMSLTLLLGVVAIGFDALAVLGGRALIRWTATGKVA
jgi:ABC-type nitrate/sulfonate/bicarbonate transport system permease component